MCVAATVASGTRRRLRQVDVGRHLLSADVLHEFPARRDTRSRQGPAHERVEPPGRVDEVPPLEAALQLGRLRDGQRRVQSRERLDLRLRAAAAHVHDTRRALLDA